MHIGLFGGSFDPPHKGHQQVAASLIELNLVDEVWFVPVYKHPWADAENKRTLAPYEDRIAMLRLILSERQSIAEYKDISFTYDTICFFQEKHPEWMFTWVMGSEYIPKFKDFLKGHPALASLPFYVYPRAGHTFKDVYSNMTPLRQFPEVQISSTEVRNRIQEKSSIDDIVDHTVVKYIQKHKLYQR